MSSHLAKAATEHCQLIKIGEFPVSVEDGLSVTSGTIDGHDAKLVVDSAAGYSIISVAAADRLHVHQIYDVQRYQTEGLAHGAAAIQASVDKLILGDLNLNNVSFIVTGSDVRPDISGLIGRNILGWADTEYDLGRHVVRLINSRSCDGITLAYWAGPTFYSVPLLRTADGAPQLAVEVKINGKPVRAMMNSAGGGTMISIATAKRVGIALDPNDSLPSPSTRYTRHRPTPQWIATASSIQLGGESTADAKIKVGEMQEGVDMVLGLDFFETHRIYIAKQQQRMYFTANPGGGLGFRDASR